MPTIASHSPLNVSETVRDRGLVPKDHQKEMAYRESNGHMTDEAMTSHDPKGQTRDPNALRAQYLEKWKQLQMMFTKNR